MVVFNFVIPMCYIHGIHLRRDETVTAASPGRDSPTVDLQKLPTALPLWLLRCGLGTAASAHRSRRALPDEVLMMNDQLEL